MIWNVIFVLAGIFTNHMCKKMNISLFSFKAVALIILVFLGLKTIKHLITGKF